jgi:TIR domain
VKHDVLISYSHADKTIADAVYATLEKRGIRCWIAPRDISPGAEWASAIAEAIPASRIFVLIHSKSSNEARQVMCHAARN